jgi:ligand-binding SRPBCC domain-containing protein
MRHFIKESRIAASPSAVFDFHESPSALERLTPPWEHVKVLQRADSILPGNRVVLRVKVGPISMICEAEHTEYVKGEMFADRQIRGPFASWYHRHLISDDGNGGAILRDEIDYEPPMGWVGKMLSGSILESKLQKLFDFRHEITRKIVESNDF